MSRPDTELIRDNPSPLRRSDETWSDFEKGYVPESLNDLLRKRVGETPDSVFAEWFEQGESLTFRQLDESAARLASSLSALGVRKTSHVAALMTGGPEFFFLWFALLRLGAVLVPINDKYTPGEIAYVVNDSD
ncbi:class I adenylate-forming enzyme family protein, partial [Marivita sp.]